MSGDPYSKLKFEEVYKDFEPPFPLIPGLRRALRVVPAKYLSGIGSIKLTNSAALPRHRRREKAASGNRIDNQGILGLYRSPQDGEKARIEIFVDRHMRKTTRNTFVARHYRTTIIARTLFHEIGHHIHKTKIREMGAKERIAIRYENQFWRRLLWRQWYRHLACVVYLASSPRFWKAVWERQTAKRKPNLATEPNPTKSKRR